MENHHVLYWLGVSLSHLFCARKLLTDVGLAWISLNYHEKLSRVTDSIQIQKQCHKCFSEYRIYIGKNIWVHYHTIICTVDWNHRRNHKCVVELVLDYNPPPHSAVLEQVRGILRLRRICGCSRLYKWSLKRAFCWQNGWQNTLSSKTTKSKQNEIIQRDSFDVWVRSICD